METLERCQSRRSSVFTVNGTNNEEFTLKHLLLLKICAREICEKFIHKHLETI